MNAPGAPRILIVRLSALGDIVHALPLLAELRRRWPDAHIGWLAEPLGRKLLDGHPLIDRLHVYARQAWKIDRRAALTRLYPALRRELIAERYATALDVQGLTKSAMWPWLAGIPTRIGFGGHEAREASAWLNNRRVRPARDRRHVVERNLSLLEPLDLIVPETPQFPLPIADEAAAEADRILCEGAPVALLWPAAGWATKTWPPERIGSLAQRLAADGLRVLAGWGPDEERLAAEVMVGAGRAPRIPDGIARVPAEPGVYALPSRGERKALAIPTLAALARRAALFVGGDTGPTHLAAALGTPTVSMMGPLDARRNGPYGAHCITIQHAIPRPAPWWRNHKRWCDPATDLRAVSVEEVYAACRALLERHPPSLAVA